MGPSLNPDDIKEGDGVYFECDVKSNPKPYKLIWYHDVSALFVLILLVLSLYSLFVECVRLN